MSSTGDRMDASTAQTFTSDLRFGGPSAILRTVGHFAKFYCAKDGPPQEWKSIWDVDAEEEARFHQQSAWTAEAAVQSAAIIANFRLQTQDIGELAADPLRLTRSIGHHLHQISPFCRTHGRTGVDCPTWVGVRFLVKPGVSRDGTAVRDRYECTPETSVPQLPAVTAHHDIMSYREPSNDDLDDTHDWEEVHEWDLEYPEIKE